VVEDLLEQKGGPERTGKLAQHRQELPLDTTIRHHEDVDVPVRRQEHSIRSFRL